MDTYQQCFERITNDPRYLANLDWGTPRRGHPEGTVRLHIAELERNLAALTKDVTWPGYWKLRILIHVHDSFKADASPGAAITDPRSHASLARAFLRDHCADEDLQAMVQYHDEPFALWRQAASRGEVNPRRRERLLAAIKDWRLFIEFQLIDGATAGKSREPLEWLIADIARELGRGSEKARNSSALRRPGRRWEDFG